MRKFSRQTLTAVIIVSLLQPQFAWAYTDLDEASAAPPSRQRVRFAEHVDVERDGGRVYAPSTRLNFTQDEVDVAGQSCAGSLLIKATGDLHLKDLDVGKDLVIRTSGQVIWGDDIKVQGQILIKADDKITIAGILHTGNYIKVESKKDIRLKHRSNIKAPHAIFKAADYIEIRSTIDMEEYLGFEAPLIKNLGNIETNGTLNLRGEFQNINGAFVRAGSIPAFAEVMEHNKGHITLTQLLEVENAATVHGTLVAEGGVFQRQVKLDIASDAEVIAYKGFFVDGSSLNNAGSLTVKGQGIEGTLQDFKNSGTACLRRVKVQVDTAENSGEVRIEEHSSVQGGTFLNTGRLCLEGFLQLNLSGEYLEQGTVYGPNLFMVNANSVYLSDTADWYLHDALVAAKGDVHVAKEAKVHFYGADYLLHVQGQNVNFHGNVLHKSAGVFPLKGYQHTSPDLINRDLRARIKAKKLKEWSLLKQTYKTPLTLQARGDLNCDHTHLNPEAGTVALIAEGKVSAKGAQIKSGHFSGHNVMAQAKGIQFCESSATSSVGRIVLQALDTASIQESRLEGGTDTVVAARDASIDRSTLVGAKGHVLLSASDKTTLSDAHLKSKLGVQGSLGGAFTVTDTDISGEVNAFHGEKGSFAQSKFVGATSLHGTDLALKDVNFGEHMGMYAPTSNLEGYLNGGTFVLQGQNVKHTAAFDGTSLHVLADEFESYGQSKADTLFFQASQKYTDCATTTMDVADGLTLLAPQSESFLGQASAGKKATYKFACMDLDTLLAQTRTPEMFADIGRGDAVFKDGFVLDPSLSLVARSFTTQGDCTAKGSLSVSLQDRMKTKGKMAIYGDASFHTWGDVETEDMWVSGDLKLASTGLVTLKGVLDGCSVDLYGRSVYGQREVTRQFTPYGHRDVLGSAVGVRARSGDAKVTAAHELHASGADFSSHGGQLKLVAPDIHLSAVELSQEEKRKGYHAKSTTHHKTNLNGDQGILLEAQGDKETSRVVLEGVDATAKHGNIAVKSDGTSADLATIDTSEEHKSKKKKGAFGSKKKSTRDEQTSTVVSNTFNAGQNITFQAAGENLHVSPEMRAGGDVSIESSEDKVRLKAEKSVHTLSQTKSSRSRVWQSLSQKGHVDETVVLPKIVARGKVSFSAKAGLAVDVVEGSLGSTLDQLAEKEEYSWLNEVKNRDDVDWHQINEVHKRWQMKASGLTPEATAVIAVTVGVATSGVGAGLAGLAGTAGAMASAGFSSALSQLVIAGINNKGNLGRTLKALGTKEQALQLVTAVAAAGLLSEISNALDIPADSKSFHEAVVDKNLDFWDRAVLSLKMNAVWEGINAPMSMARGEDPLSALDHMWRGVLAGTMTQAGAYEIGTLKTEGEVSYVPHKLLHALNGGLGGLIQASDGDLGAVLRNGLIPGAFGAAGAEVLADFWQEQLFDPKDPERSLRQVIAWSKLSVAAMALLSDVDPGASVNAADTALEYNFAISFQDDDGYNTDDEAEQTTYGQERKKVLASLEEVWNNIEEAAGLTIDPEHEQCLQRIYEQGRDAYVDEYLQAEAKSKGYALTPVEKIYHTLEGHMYFDMVQDRFEPSAAQRALYAIGAVVDLPLTVGEYALRAAGMPKGEARALHWVADDALMCSGLGGLLKNATKTTVKQTGKAVGKGAARPVHATTIKHDTPHSHELPKRVLSAKEKGKMAEGVDARTLNKEDYKHLDWDRRFSNRRNRGVSRFWADERARLRKGETPTRNWSDSQKQDILQGKVPKHAGKPIQVHHKYNAPKYPHIADQSEHVYPATQREHLQRWHGGKWKNDTHGQPIKPTVKEDF